jgi:hypothetical protein
MSEEEIQEIEATYDLKVPRDQLVSGAVVGTVDLDGCVTDHRSKWFDEKVRFCAGSREADGTGLPKERGQASTLYRHRPRERSKVEA